MKELIVITSHIKDTNAEKNEKGQDKESRTLRCALGKDKESKSEKDSEGKYGLGVAISQPPFLIEVFIMNELDRTVLYSHGFRNSEVQEILLWMAELRDAKEERHADRDFFSDTYCRNKIFYLIERFTSNRENRLRHIGMLHPIYKLLADYTEPRYKEDNGWVK